MARVKDHFSFNSSHNLVGAWEALKSRPPVFFTDNSRQLEEMKAAVSSALDEQQRELEQSWAETRRARQAEDNAVSTCQEMEATLRQTSAEFESTRAEFAEYRQRTAQQLLEMETAHRRVELEYQDKLTLAMQDADSQISKLSARTTDLDERLRSTHRSKLYAEDVLERTKQAHASEVGLLEQELAQCRPELTRLQHALTAAQHDANAANSRAQLLQTNLTASEAKVSSLSTQLKELVTAQSLEHRELVAARSQTAEYKAELRRALEQARTTGDRLTKLTVENDFLAEEASAATKDRDMAESLLDQTAVELKYKEMAVEGAEAACADVQQALEASYVRRAQAEMEVAKLQAEAQARVEELDGVLADMQQTGTERDEWHKLHDAEQAAKQALITQIAIYDQQMCKLQIALRDSLRKSRLVQEQHDFLKASVRSHQQRANELEAEVQAKCAVCNELQSHLSTEKNATSEAQSSVAALTAQLKKLEEVHAQLMQENADTRSTLGSQAAALTQQLTIEQAVNTATRDKLSEYGLAQNKSGTMFFNPYISEDLDNAAKMYKDSMLGIKSGESVNYALREGAVETRRYALGSEIASTALESWTAQSQAAKDLSDVVSQEVMNIRHNYM